MYYCGRDVVNTMWFEDPLGGKVGLRFRRLATAQEVKWRRQLIDAELAAKDGDTIGNKQQPVFVEAAKVAMTGLEPGCFCDAEGTPLASSPGEEGYRADWREIVIESGSIDQLLYRLGWYLMVDLRNKTVVVTGKNSPATSPPCAEVAAMTASEPLA